MKLCEICHKKAARYKYCETCASKVQRLQTTANKKSYRKMGAQGQRRKKPVKQPVKQPFELKLLNCLKCGNDFLSTGKNNRICSPCWLANANVYVL